MKKILIQHIIVLIIVIIASIILLPDIALNELKENEARIHRLSSLYEQSSVDFHVINPGFNQIDTLSNQTSITKVVPYYSMNLTVNISNTQLSYDVVMIEDFDDLVHTPYNEERLVLGSLPSNSNQVLIDFAMANRYGVKIGDTLSFSLGSPNTTFLYTVSGIIENNPIRSQGAVVVEYTTTLDNAIRSIPAYPNGLIFAGAYIISSNLNDTWGYLSSNYQPLAIKRDRTEFDNDLAYEQYLAIFNSQDYARDIYRTAYAFSNAQSEIDTYQSTININSIIITLWYSIVLPLSFIGLILVNKKFIHKLISKGMSKISIFAPLVFSALLAFFILQGILLIIQSNHVSSLGLFNPNGFFSTSVLISVFVGLAAIIFGDSIAFYMTFQGVTVKASKTSTSKSR